MQNLTNHLENILKMNQGDQKSFELALFSKNIMDMERGPESLLITAILTEEHNSKPRHSVAFGGGSRLFLLGMLTTRSVLNTKPSYPLIDRLLENM